MNNTNQTYQVYNLLRKGLLFLGCIVFVMFSAFSIPTNSGIEETVDGEKVEVVVNSKTNNNEEVAKKLNSIIGKFNATILLPKPNSVFVNITSKIPLHILYQKLLLDLR